MPIYLKSQNISYESQMQDAWNEHDDEHTDDGANGEGDYEEWLFEDPHFFIVFEQIRYQDKLKSSQNCQECEENVHFGEQRRSMLQYWLQKAGNDVLNWVNTEWVFQKDIYYDRII